MSAKKKVIIGILIFLIITISGFLPIVLVFGTPFALIYAIYRAIIGIMTHNANLKSQRDNDEWRNR